MITISSSFYGGLAAMPAGPAPSFQAGAATAHRSEPAASAPSSSSATTPAVDAAAAQQRYFEDMINSAADLLLRTQTLGSRSRFDP